MEQHDLSLTAMEQQVLEALINELYAEPGFSDVDANDLSRITEIPTTSIRGVLASLVKKGIISLSDTATYGAAKQYVLIYLSESHYYLHPRWKAEYDYQNEN